MDRRFPVVEFEASRFRDFFGNLADKLEVKLLNGGACNSNYSVRTSKGDRFVCRIHQRGNPRAERSVMELLKGAVPAPESLWIGEGVSVMSFVEGTHFRPTRNLVREAGRIIGKLAAIPLGQRGEILPNGDIVPFVGWETFELGLSELLEKEAMRSRLGEESLATLRELLVRHRDLLQSFDACHNLVHGDFRPDNILVKDDAITGILDWEFAHSGCSYMDIGNLLRHLPSGWEVDLSQGLQEEGFQLPDDWRFRSQLIDLASHLEFLTSERSGSFKQACFDRIVFLVEQSAKFKK